MGEELLANYERRMRRHQNATAPECNATLRSSQFGEAALAMLIGVLGDRFAFRTRRRRWGVEHAAETGPEVI